MSAQWCLSVIFWVVVGVVFVKSVPALVEKSTSRSTTDACHIPGCKCTDAAKMWKIINCTFNNTQKVEFTPNSIPSTIMEISISGGDEVIFQPQTFNSLGGFHLVRLDGTRHFRIRKSSFLDLTSASLLLQIQSCDHFIVDTNAFKNMQTPVSIEVSRCSHVLVQRSAFGRLQDGKFHKIPYLELQEGAFNFENQGIVSRHGPVATLSFDEVIIPIVPKAAFQSSLAEVNIRNSEIREIHFEAFRANQISLISIVNSSVQKIQSGAFSDRTLLINFKLSRCKVKVWETKAMMASMTNLTVEHSRITEIQTGAINSTVANVVITDNEIENFKSSGIVLHNWNRISVNDNIIKTIHSTFLDLPYNPNIQQLEFTFIGNEIYRIDYGALNFITDLKLRVNKLTFDNNFFNQTCQCDIEEWIFKWLGVAGGDVSFVINSSYCTINSLLARCFELKEGLINMHNFTQLVCGTGESIKCEPYAGDTKILDTKSTMLKEDAGEANNSGLILGIVLGAVLIIAVCGTIIILLIRGSLWLKRKGYCMRFRNLHYHEGTTPDDEGTIVTTETSDKGDIPEELTPEILQKLREQLEDPSTHDDAREMIERLYELFITGDSRQDEEAHLYEELGNLQLPQNVQQEKRHNNHNGEYNEPFDFLKMMEEKYKNGANVIAENNSTQPPIVGDYSEPTDAAVHLYSELQNKNDQTKSYEKGNSLKSLKSNTQKSNNSMAFRPLPEKPRNNFDSEAGPSKSYCD